MARPVEVKVNESTFFITPMDAFEALEVFGDLQKDLLPAIGDLISAGLGQSEEQGGLAVASAIEKLSLKLDGKQLKTWVDRLVTADSVAVSINGQDMALDKAARALAFREFTEILELLFHVIKVNFAAPLGRWLSHFGLDLSLVKADQLARIAQKSSGNF
ncbi:MAG TPA: hypothetical protein PLP85_13625 [Alcaligenes sp.]|nr:hypothetical protein [Alcaligenes sp.]